MLLIEQKKLYGNQHITTEKEDAASPKNTSELEAVEVDLRAAPTEPVASFESHFLEQGSPDRKERKEIPKGTSE